MSLRRQSSSFLILWLIVSCSAPQRSGTFASSDLDPPPAFVGNDGNQEQDRVERAIDPASEPSGGAPRTDRVRLNVCSSSEEECAWRADLDRAIGEGELKRARILLDAHLKPPVTNALRATILIVDGRLLLESESLAYGAGSDKSEEALVMFEEALKLDPLRGDAKLQRARALLSLGRGEDALTDLRLLASSDESNAEVHAALGIALLSVGQVQSALLPLRKASELDPSEAERLVVLGSAQMLEGQLDAAESSFRAAIHLESGSARAHGNLGAVLLIVGKVDEGKGHLKRASLLAPTKATYVSNLAYAELLDAELDSAARHARRAIELDPKLASAWLNLGLVQVALNQHRQAKASFERAQGLDPSDPRPKNNLKDLKELKK